MPCLAKPKDEETQRSLRISKELKREFKKYERVTQLLLLGTGESGKTTIIKQMKIIHINGFSEEEKREKIPFIKQNIHESIYSLVSNMTKISPPTELHNESNKVSAEYILNIGIKEPEKYSQEYFDRVKNLWNDPGVKETFKRSNEFQLIDSAPHFLDRIEDIRQLNYIPSVQDMLFCRVKTVAISKIEFSVQYHGSKVDFWMYDVGGQRGERKKWISVFEGITAILFLIAASDFDQTLREDDKTNRLKEGFKVFADVFWSRFVQTAGKIVFLNKQDLLKQKIEDGKQINKYFPEFNNFKLTEKGVDPTNEYEKAKHFMKHKIMDIVKHKPEAETVDIVPGGIHVTQERPDQSVYIHFTTATDTNNIKRVFDSVKDIILIGNLKQEGLM